MADKLRRTFPVKVTFADGEQPTSQKLNAIAEQARNGLAIIEKALGDLWNQSGDSIFLNFPTQLPNLARIIGENGYLNPAIYPIDDFNYVEDLGTKHTNRTTGHLLFKPQDTSWYVSGTGMFASPAVATEDLVNSTGDWWVDPDTGRFRTFDPLTTATDQLTYAVDPSADWGVREETLPGVIPDPGQADFQYVRVSESSGTYFIHLPPRRPLTLSDRERPTSYPPTTEITNNSATAAGSPYKYWQDGVTALADAHYRYSLPKEIVDNWPAAGTELPQGTMYLWNDTTQTIIEDVVFKVPLSGSDKFVIEVTSDTFDFDTVDTASEAEANYSSTNLLLITCGSPLTRSIWSLVSAFYKHKHDNTGSLEPPMSHNSLEDQNPPVSAYSGHLGTYPSDLPSWRVSSWANDPHTSLLSRGGSQGSGSERDLFNNAMLGDLLLANANASSYLDGAVTDGSFKVLFGDVDGPYLQAIDDEELRYNAPVNSVLGVGDPTSNQNISLKLYADTTYTGGSFAIERATGVNGSAFISQRGVGPLTIGCVDAAKIMWKTSNNERMSLDASGNLSLDDGNLEVDLGNVDINTGYLTVNTGDVHINAGDLHIGATPIASDSGSLRIAGNMTIGSSRYICGDGQLALMAEGTLFLVADSNDISGGSGEDIVIGIGSDSSTFGDTYANLGTIPRQEWARFDGSAGGWLGIGTPSPQEMLHVAGDALLEHSGSPSLYVRTTATASQQANIVLRGARTGAGTTTASIQGFNNRTASDGTADTQITFFAGSTEDAGGIDFYTRNGGTLTQRMRIDSGGQIYCSGSTQLSLGDANFKMDFNTTDEPRLYFASDAYIKYDRVADGLSVNIAGVTCGYFSNSATFGGLFTAPVMIPTSSLKDPGAVGTAHALTTNTTPFCIAAVSAAGTLQSEDHWNVASSSRTSAGVFRVEYTNIRINSGQVPAFATPNAAGRTCAANSQNSSFRVDVYIWLHDGTLSDTGFSVIVYAASS